MPRIIKGILLNATAIPINAIAKIAPRENRTKIHLILPNSLPPKIMFKNIITLVSLVI